MNPHFWHRGRSVSQPSTGRCHYVCMYVCMCWLQWFDIVDGCVATTVKPAIHTHTAPLMKAEPTCDKRVCMCDRWASGLWKRWQDELSPTFEWLCHRQTYRRHTHRMHYHHHQKLILSWNALSRETTLSFRYRSCFNETYIVFSTEPNRKWLLAVYIVTSCPLLSLYGIIYVICIPVTYQNLWELRVYISGHMTTNSHTLLGLWKCDLVIYSVTVNIEMTSLLVMIIFSLFANYPGRQ